MTTTINASSTNGIVQTADGSGVMKLQSNGVTTNALAWVNFNGTGTVAIRSSYNVSSVTDNGVGDYTVNFTTAMSDANYAILFTPGGQETTSTSNFDMPKRSTTPTSSSVRVLYSNGNQDTLYGSVVIFGN